MTDSIEAGHLYTEALLRMGVLYTLLQTGTSETWEEAVNGLAWLLDEPYETVHDQTRASLVWFRTNVGELASAQQKVIFDHLLASHQEGLFQDELDDDDFGDDWDGED